MEDRNRDADARSRSPLPGGDDQDAPDAIEVYESPSFFRRYSRLLILLAVVILIAILVLLLI